MKELKNPFLKLPGYNCFACAEDNECGLQMKFHEEGDKIVCNWEPREHLQGYFNVLHGGVQATLMDEIASWVVFIKLETAGVTSNLQVKYKRPLFTNKGALRIEASLIKMKRNIAIIEAKIYNSDGNVGSEAVLHYFTFSQDKAASELKYPGKEDFYE
jgi:uncharacterized protein (TIGR00369 family)